MFLMQVQENNERYSLIQQSKGRVDVAAPEDHQRPEFFPALSPPMLIGLVF